MRSDIEIAAAAVLRPIRDIARDAGLLEHEWEPYGHYKAKVNDQAMQRLAGQPDGKLVLVTAINPTPAGEGKTTTTVGLGQAPLPLAPAVIALESHHGTGVRHQGGAAAAGMAQVLPMEDINCNFTGDLHAWQRNTCWQRCHNHIQQGNR